MLSYAIRSDKGGLVLVDPRSLSSQLDQYRYWCRQGFEDLDSST